MSAVRFYLDGLEAVDVEGMNDDPRVEVVVSPNGNHAPWAVFLAAESREAIVNYVLDGWGDDDGRWLVRTCERISTTPAEGSSPVRPGVWRIDESGEWFKAVRAYACNVQHFGSDLEMLAFVKAATAHGAFLRLASQLYGHLQPGGGHNAVWSCSDDPDFGVGCLPNGATVTVRAAGSGKGPLREGDRVKLRHDVDRFPHFVAPAGAFGTVVALAPSACSVRLDDPVPGAEPWDNEVRWDDGDNPLDDIIVV